MRFHIKLTLKSWALRAEPNRVLEDEKKYESSEQKKRAVHNSGNQVYPLRECVYLQSYLFIISCLKCVMVGVRW